jgi:hypothetical protein
MPEIAEGIALIKLGSVIRYVSLILTLVARIVHFLRLHLVGKKIAKVSAPDDTIIFGKVGTSGPEIEAALKGRKVRTPWRSLEALVASTSDVLICRLSQLEAKANTSGELPSERCNGSSFLIRLRITLDKPPHVVMHLGMTGNGS